MEEIGLYEAKTQLSRLVERASRGERITITRHGTPVAMLVPPQGSPAMSRRAAIEELKRFRIRHPIDRGTLLEWLDETRRP